MAKVVAKRGRPVKRTIKHELKSEIGGLILVVLACVSLVSLFSPQPGNIGQLVNEVLKSIAGGGRVIIPLILIFLGLQVMNRKHHPAMTTRVAASCGLFLLLLAFLHLQLPGFEFMKRPQIFAAGQQGLGGGLLGAALSYAVYKAFGPVGSYVVIFGLSLVLLVVLTNRSITEAVKNLWTGLKQVSQRIYQQLQEFLFVVVEDEDRQEEKPAKRKPSKREEREKDGQQAAIRDIPLIINGAEYRESMTEEEPPENLFTPAPEPAGQVQKPESAPGVVTSTPITRQIAREGLLAYTLPSLSLLQRSIKIKNTRLNKDISDNVKTLEDTLESFGVKVKVTQVTRGPAITRYEAQPAPGVKVSKIVNLADDIALSLAAQDVRIEAPIPGKPAVGIEVPNKDVAVVQFREVLESPEFNQTNGKLPVALGKDIAGNGIVADLTRMPHLLIAGATGSGKSVCMNTLITSILFKAKPNEVKFLMVDPKMVELTNYNGIPHLAAPVVTDPKKAASALKWVVTEMETRYELFAAAGVRDIVRYNFLKAKEQGATPALPYVVVLIDELADLMMVAPGDVEDAICRLAQMARAAGIHLVVATQRPSVDVITGIIKANIPSRIAFAVSSQTDSRTILDMNGAEKLLGRGDMLFYPMGAAKPVRVQGCFVSDKEVETVVNFLKEQGKPEYMDVEFNSEVAAPTANEEEDELFYDAAKLFIENGNASVSMLQRRLRVGYTRAARLVDLLEQKGVVGPYEGSKPREVLLTMGQFETKFGQKS
ncbi:MAG TPA: DNA translocase FtsK [Desulfobacteria bacterium]|nr:DNA translocase FtsK [Desulfobacteria bacterium]